MFGVASSLAGMSEMAALVVDYGGVLTSPLQDAMAAWCDSDEIDISQFRQVMRGWLGAPWGEEAVTNPVHALERGEIAIPHFEQELAGRLRTHDGRPVDADGLLARMFAGFRREQPMVDAVRRAHAQGLRTALLSNSWGNDYPRHEWDGLFDAVVISGEVGMRKPEPGIYLHTANLLGVEPPQCVFVDDLSPNVRGAVSVGMVGVRHVAPAQTLDELEALFGLALRG